MDTILNIIHIILAVLLIALVLVQGKGAGLSAAFGGGSGGNAFTARRGAEATIYRITIIVSILFFGLALARLFI